MNLNFLMAIFWLFIGFGLVFYHWLKPEATTLRMNWTGWSAGWLVVVFALWNLIRWWSARAAEKDRRFEEDMAFHRQRKRYDTIGRDEEGPPNPEFDFTKPEAKEGEGSSNGPKPPPA